MIPNCVRVDLGTENVGVARLQRALKNKYSSSTFPAFLTGASTHNTRIESWWGQLRKHAGQYYMDLFAELHNFALFSWF